MIHQMRLSVVIVALGTFPNLEDAGNRRKPQSFAENRRFSQKTAGNRRLGSVTLGPSPLARPYKACVVQIVDAILVCHCSLKG